MLASMNAIEPGWVYGVALGNICGLHSLLVFCHIPNTNGPAEMHTMLLSLSSSGAIDNPSLGIANSATSALDRPAMGNPSLLDFDPSSRTVDVDAIRRKIAPGTG